jgi:hypothetical protein
MEYTGKDMFIQIQVRTVNIYLCCNREEEDGIYR